MATYKMDIFNSTLQKLKIFTVTKKWKNEQQIGFDGDILHGDWMYYCRPSSQVSFSPFLFRFSSQLHPYFTRIFFDSDEFMRMYMFKKRSAVNDGSMFGQALSDWKTELGDDYNDHAAEEVYKIPMFSF